MHSFGSLQCHEFAGVELTQRKHANKSSQTNMHLPLVDTATEEQWFFKER
jgi:hypothetical protein